MRRRLGSLFNMPARNCLDERPGRYLAPRSGAEVAPGHETVLERALIGYLSGIRCGSSVLLSKKSAMSCQIYFQRKRSPFSVGQFEDFAPAFRVGCPQHCRPGIAVQSADAGPTTRFANCSGSETAEDGDYFTAAHR